MEPRAVFSTEEALKYGWARTRAHLRTVLIPGLIGGFLAMLSNALTAQGARGSELLVALINLLNVAVALIWIRMGLSLHDGRPIPREDPMQWVAGYLGFLLTQVLFSLIVSVGLVLLVIPGILWAAQFAFAPFLVVDQQRDPIAALKESSRLTRGQRPQLIVFGLAVFGVNLLGALAFGVGLLLTVPTSVLAAAYVFRRLQAHAGVPVPDTRIAPTGPQRPVTT